MDKARQQWLPEVKGVRSVYKNRKTPEPRLRKYAKVKKFEIVYRPLDLQFRFRLGKWFEEIGKKEGVDVLKILGKKEKKRLCLYLTPQGTGKKWLTQKQVSRILGEESEYKFRSFIVVSLCRLWEEVRVL